MPHSGQYFKYEVERNGCTEPPTDLVSVEADTGRGHSKTTNFPHPRHEITRITALT